MSQKSREKLHLIYSIVLSGLIVVLGGCLIFSCITIYKSGDRPFTPESISKQFGKIIIPTVLCIAGILGGVVISLVFPLEKRKVAPVSDARVKVARLREKLSGSCESADAVARKRRTFRIASICLMALSALPVIFYLFRGSNFTSEVNKSIVFLVLVMLPCAVFAFGIAVALSFFEAVSLEKEARLIREKIGVSASPAKANKKGSGMIAVWVLRGVIFNIAAAFILIGILNGGMSDVLEKAIKICTECIGLG